MLLFADGKGRRFQAFLLAVATFKFAVLSLYMVCRLLILVFLHEFCVLYVLALTSKIQVPGDSISKHKLII